MPKVAVVRNGQDCYSAHKDCRTTSHLQKKQKCIYAYVCVCVYTYIDIYIKLASKTQMAFTLHISDHD